MGRWAVLGGEGSALGGVGDWRWRHGGCTGRPMRRWSMGREAALEWLDDEVSALDEEGDGTRGVGAAAGVGCGGAGRDLGGGAARCRCEMGRTMTED